MRAIYIAGALALCLAACKADNKIEPDPAPYYTDPHKGRVLFDVCGNIAVQCTDGPPKGQMGWRHGGDSTVYNNVFRVANPCTWGWDGTNKDITFTFSVEEPQKCALCLAWTATPDSAYFIHVLK